jgi:lipoprotein-releasing system permease protein
MNFRWIFFVSRRFSRVDRRSRSAATGLLSSLGICFGVMTLIVTLSVMNGFQRSYIDSIMEISSSHIRYRAPFPAGDATEALLSGVEAQCLGDPSVIAATPFLEAQTLMTGVSAPGKGAREQAARIRAVPGDITRRDRGFASEVRIIRGSFSLGEPQSIVLGSALARSLGVSVGGQVNLLALSGGEDVALLSGNRLFTVTGVFHSGYADINSAYAFISLEDGLAALGESTPVMFSIKLRNPDRAAFVLRALQAKMGGAIVEENGAPPQGQGTGGVWEAWRHYNRAFFGALRVEKNILMLLVVIIFVVVGVNIYNGMRRMVFERRAEIAVFSALGGRKDDIQSVFVLRGLLTGLMGAIPGLILGLLICVQIDGVFMLISAVQYRLSLFAAMLVDPQRALLLRENPMYTVFASIPARVFPHEALATTLFGFLSALFASWAASRQLFSLKIAEVLRDE